MREVPIVVMLTAASCGRVGFDSVSNGRDAGDANVGDAALATSCSGLAATCGSTGLESCCGSLVVPGGTYARSYDVAGDGMYPSSSFPATVSTFRLDQYEVTVGRFRKFADEGGGTQTSPPSPGSGARANLSGSGWDASFTTSLTANTTALLAALKCDSTYATWTDAPGSNESKPIVCITWFEAMAFCAWDGGFLPTEAEWNYVAAGGSLQSAYPWSSPPGSTSIDCTVANYGGANWPSAACNAAGADRVGNLAPLGDGLWGHSDLGGNAWEWVLDWHSTYPSPCDDCANFSSGVEKIVRGGSFNSIVDHVRTGVRLHYSPTQRFPSIGVRCARAP